MKFRKSLVVLVSLVVLCSCGRPAQLADSTVPATTLPTTLVATTAVSEATLGVTPEEFITEWNRQLAVHEFLQLEASETQDGSSLVANFTDQWGLELAVDPESGELVTAEVWGSMNVHTDQIIMLFATLISMVQASNSNLNSEMQEAWETVPERIGFPLPENEDPQWMNEETYTSEREVEGIIYTFEKSGLDVSIAARPAG